MKAIAIYLSSSHLLSLVPLSDREREVGINKKEYRTNSKYRNIYSVQTGHYNLSYLHLCLFNTYLQFRFLHLGMVERCN